VNDQPPKSGLISHYYEIFRCDRQVHAAIIVNSYDAIAESLYLLNRCEETLAKLWYHSNEKQAEDEQSRSGNC